MRKLSIFAAAFVLALGLAQCKKEQPAAQNETEGVRITLNVGPSTGSGTNGSRVDVNPDAQQQVTFTDGDEILVVSGGKYVGSLTRTDGAFSGTITNPVQGEKLYFYFLGNNAVLNDPVDGEIKGCTVNISDQRNYPHLPVISMGKSIEKYPSEGDSYTSRLYNKASLMKFNVVTPSTAPICITGMNNTVTVDFGDPTDAGFVYGMDGDGVIKMAGGSGTAENPAVKWAIVLPQDEAITTPYSEGEDGNYIGTSTTIHAIEPNKYYDGGIGMTMNNRVWNGNLAILTVNDPAGFATATNGMTIYGTLISKSVKVSIAADATVMLSNAKIYGNTGAFAGLTCEGNATIILEGENTVIGFDSEYPGIQAGPEGTTLTIKGSGSLNASTNGSGAGIGGGQGQSQNSRIDCGNIVIEGGNITANSSGGSAAIGGGSQFSRCGDITITGGTIKATSFQQGPGIGSGNVMGVCGDITITGGDIEATGDSYTPGIGSGLYSSCGAITITNTVTKVKATKGSDAPNSIGAGQYGTCGTVTIGGTTYDTGVTPNQSDGVTYIYPVPPTIITWGNDIISSMVINVNNNELNSYSNGGITVTPTNENAIWGGNSISLFDYEAALTFSTPNGKNITKIEITISEYGGSLKGIPSFGWSYSYPKLTWTGSSNSVDLGCISSKAAPGGSEPGIGPGPGGGGIIESVFQLDYILQVQFTLQ